MIGQGPSAQTVKIDLPHFTLIGATTRAGLLSSPLRDRFGVIARLAYYPPADLVRILARSARILGIALAAEGALEIATRSRGTPRISNRLLRRVRDFAEVGGEPEVTRELARFALARLEVDEAGFDRMDRALLRALVEKYGGGPVGLDTLAAAIGEDRGTIEDIYEPFLIQECYLDRTPRGRVATERAYSTSALPGARAATLRVRRSCCDACTQGARSAAATDAAGSPASTSRGPRTISSRCARPADSRVSPCHPLLAAGLSGWLLERGGDKLAAELRAQLRLQASNGGVGGAVADAAAENFGLFQQLAAPVVHGSAGALGLVFFGSALLPGGKRRRRAAPGKSKNPETVAKDSPQAKRAAAREAEAALPGPSGREGKKYLKQAAQIREERGAEAAGEYLLGQNMKDEAADLFMDAELWGKAAEVRHDQNRFDEAAELYKKLGKEEQAVRSSRRSGATRKPRSATSPRKVLDRGRDLRAPKTSPRRQVLPEDRVPPPRRAGVS